MCFTSLSWPSHFVKKKMSKRSYCICGIDYAIMAFGFPEATTLTEILYFGWHTIGAKLIQFIFIHFNKTLQDQVHSLLWSCILTTKVFILMSMCLKSIHFLLRKICKSYCRHLIERLLLKPWSTSAVTIDGSLLYGEWKLPRNSHCKVDYCCNLFLVIEIFKNFSGARST